MLAIVLMEKTIDLLPKSIKSHTPKQTSTHFTSPVLPSSRQREQSWQHHSHVVIHSPREHSHRRGEEGEAAQPSLGALVPHLVTEGSHEGGDLGGEEGKGCVWCLHSVRCPAHLLLG